MTTHKGKKGVMKEVGQAIRVAIREKRFKSVMDAKGDNTSESQTSKIEIQKVPYMLQSTKDFKNCFEPRVVSIGPYHHGKDKLKRAEKLKLLFTEQFINSNKQTMKDLQKKILDDIKTLRKCYDKEPTDKYDDDALAWMLFVDGCSVLHYIRCYTNGELKKWKMFNDQRVASVHRDLFLLENQLPFKVLDILMKARFKDINEGKKMIEKFIRMSITTQQRKAMKQKLQQPLVMNETHSHLLELLQKRILGKPRQTDNQEPQGMKEKLYQLLKPLRNITICKPRKPNNKEDYYNKEDDWHSFRNVTELTAVGIHLKPSETNCLKDVSFKSHFIHGDLILPPIIVDDSMRQTFLNLIAYEMTLGEENVASYICFLDSLIDHPDDVKQLRAAHVLHNFLGSDEEVAKVFNEIAIDLVPNPEIYKDVKADIQKRYDDRWKSWMAQVIHDHFRSPWTIIAFIGAVLVIILTVVQTYFTINPRSSDCDSLCKYLKKRYI